MLSESVGRILLEGVLVSLDTHLSENGDCITLTTASCEIDKILTVAMAS